MERERDALELRKAGASYSAIARQLGYHNEGGAYKAVQRGLTRMFKEPTEDVRDLELARLDALQVSQWQNAVKGNQSSVDRVLAIMDRRAKYLGLHAAEQIEIEGAITAQGISVEQIDVDIERLLARFGPGIEGSATLAPANGQANGHVRPEAEDTGR